MASRSPPDYYAILEVSEKASTSQIRTAYKRAALKTHPDRVSNDSPERAQRTRRFQLVNDAYYTLSDTRRRKDYDAQRRLFKRSRRPSPPPGSAPADPFEDADHQQQQQQQGAPPPGGDFSYSWAWDFFSKNGAGHPASERQHAEDAQFRDVFEEMMREEGLANGGTGAGAGAGAGAAGTAQPTGKFWGMVGAVSGGALGFIVANVPGLLAGAVAGNRLGAVRDTRGKSVYQVYQELPQNDRARLLGQLAVRVMSHVAAA